MLRNAANPRSVVCHPFRTSFQPASRLNSTDAQSHKSPPRDFGARIVLATKRLAIHPSPNKRVPIPRAQRAEGSEEEKRLLRPYVLSARLQKLCDDDNLDTAILTLRNAPLDAQNAIVWNLVMREALKIKRSKLAFQLYIDMKRRGFHPTIRTFLTMFGGLCILDDWPLRTKQLDSLNTLFENYKDYVEQLKRHDPSSSDLVVAPVSGYFKILGDTGQWQKMFEVYQDMDSEGPLAPNQFVYTAMFRAIQKRGTSTTGGADSDMRLENARDVKHLWRQMVKRSQKTPSFPVDSHLIVNALVVLGLGSPADQLFAFDIVRDYLGLTKPGEEPHPPQIPHSPHVLTEALHLCNITSKPRLCIHYFQQVRDRPLKQGEKSILTQIHMEHVLRAYAALSAMGSLDESHQVLETLEWMLEQDVLGNSAMRPSLSTYTLVLNACWRGKDWASAARTFELMTGYHADAFRDPSEGGSEVPMMDQRSQGRNMVPNARAMSFLARTALVSRDQANLRQCLRMIAHLGVDDALSERVRKSDRDSSPERLLSKQVPATSRDPEYYVAKLADDLVRLVKEARGGEGDTGEEKKWLALQAKAKQFLRAHPLPKRTPVLEERPLGSARGLAATENVVEYALTKRSMKT
ncbi:hypothetical protein B0H21DRAFT_344406 [Amylocystis lapponica]|nr:hypothetical protein B0H21DRAFT_344406 [Amylocystis lapponica]